MPLWCTFCSVRSKNLLLKVKLELQGTWGTVQGNSTTCSSECIHCGGEIFGTDVFFQPQTCDIVDGTTIKQKHFCFKNLWKRSSKKVYLWFIWVYLQTINFLSSTWHQIKDWVFWLLVVFINCIYMEKSVWVFWSLMDWGNS